MGYERDIGFVKYLREGGSYFCLIKEYLSKLKYMFTDIHWDIIDIKVRDVIPKLVVFLLLLMLSILNLVYFVTILPLKALKRKYLRYQAVKIFQEHGFKDMIKRFKNYEFKIT